MQLQSLEVVSGLHFTTDLTLGYGKVVSDYLARRKDLPEKEQRGRR